jgi:hypothetical protein
MAYVTLAEGPRMTIVRLPRLPIVLLGLSLAMTQAAANAAPLDTAGATQCQVTGWAKDTDPRGTHIRGAPRGDAPIIGHLAPLTKISKDEWTGVTFDIVGSKDGWLLIQNPDRADGLKLDADHVADGRGWIWGGLVGTQSLRGRSVRGRAARRRP